MPFSFPKYMGALFRPHPESSFGALFWRALCRIRTPNAVEDENFAVYFDKLYKKFL